MTNKNWQEQKSKILVAIPKKAQEEMVGFALIIIVVSVILLIFLGFSLNKSQKENVESYEVESFIQSFLQYTTECKDNFDFLSLRQLVYKCQSNEMCVNEKNPCDVLNQSAKDLVVASWKVGAERPAKGYEFTIIANNKTLVELSEGNETINSKGSIQYLPREIVIYFTAYY